MISDTTSRAVILMGVSGSGRSTVGTSTSLAQRLECPFLDADNFHPAANVEKMKRGIPLNDEDRMPWLARLHDELEHRLGSGASVVLGCSALKESYRKILEEGLSQEPICSLGKARGCDCSGRTSPVPRRARTNRQGAEGETLPLKMTKGQRARVSNADGPSHC
jgi:gluconokinase